MNPIPYQSLKSLAVILMSSVFLSSCDGGSAAAITGAGALVIAISDIQDSGNVAIPPICGNAAGEWRGTTRGGRVILLTLRQNDRCEINGEAGFPPCLSITPVKGEALFLDNAFQVETIDGSLFVKNNVEESENIDFSRIGRYRFTNVQNKPGCPATESGKLDLTKTA